MRIRFANLAGVFLMCICVSALVYGQNQKPSMVQKDVPDAVSGAKKKTDLKKTWFAIARISGTFDSNFGQDPVAIRSFGIIPAFEVGYQILSERQRIKLNYSIGSPHYTNFEKYNRIGQYFAGAYRFNIGKGWGTETEAEGLIRGTGEDRELNNQYIFTQNLAYRFAKKNKINLYAAYRLKTNSDDPDQDADNPQFGAKYSRELTSKLGWEAGYRYDKNRARGARQRYIRRTYSTAFNFAPTARDKFSFEARYTPRLYERTVRVGDLRVPRKDKKWTFDLGWRHYLTSSFGFDANYGFETRNSNDPDKIYHNHQVIFAFFYRWGDKEN